jgi:predicted Rossmann fold flavoprotein
MLLKECGAAKAEIRTDCSVEKVVKNKLFEIETNQGNFFAENLVIASGGLSFPKIGASAFGYEIAEQFGLKLTETRPSLVPLVFSNGQNFSKLAGVSIDSNVSLDKISFRENILFTHRGLSGPAILQISNYWDEKKPVKIDLLPEIDAEKVFEQNRTGKQNLHNFLSKFLPNRFAEIFTSQNFANKPLNQLGKKEIEKIVQNLDSWQVRFDETEGWHKAEVTLGGVDTNELSSQTMESKKNSGLYFIGEIVDVTGWLGGYNFQWAWASGFAAGNVI